MGETKQEDVCGVSNGQNSEEFLQVEQSDIKSSKEIKTEFAITNDGWIPDKAKKSYHDQRLSQSKWAFRLSFWGVCSRICSYHMGNAKEHWLKQC